MNRAVFLDRDGLLIEDRGYISSPEEVVLVAGVSGALARLRTQAWRLVVVSNQSGVGRGWITHQQHIAVHQRFEALLAKEGIHLDGAFYCLHSPGDACSCRKPQPGLLLRAADSLGVDLCRSCMVGDRESDVEAGLAAGCGYVARAGAGRTLGSIVDEMVGIQ